MPESKVSSSGEPGIMTQTTKNTVIVVLIIAALLLLIIAIVYIANLIKKSGLKRVDLQKKLIALDNKAVVPYSIPNGLMTIVNRGQEYSLATWLYLGPQYESTTQHKLIFQRGNTSQVPGTYDFNTSPLVFLDKATNRLYVAISTTAVTSSSMTLDDIVSRNLEGKFESGYLVTYIDYVPLQRWVYVLVIVRDNNVMLFMDGDLYSVVSIADIAQTSSNNRPILRGSAGDATIGSAKTMIKGFVAKTQYYNYGLNQKDITKAYKEGPMKKSWLTLFGISNYGVRSPIYNLDNAEEGGN